MFLTEAHIAKVPTNVKHFVPKFTVVWIFVYYYYYFVVIIIIIISSSSSSSSNSSITVVIIFFTLNGA